MKIIPGEEQVSSGSFCESFWVDTRVGLIESSKIAISSVESKKACLLDFLLKRDNKMFESIGCKTKTKTPAFSVD